MKLAGQEEWMIYAFYDFYKIFVRIYSCSTYAPSSVFVAIRIVTFTPVTVTFYNFVCAVNFGGQATFFQYAVVVAKSHCATSLKFPFLIFHGVDNHVFAVNV